MSTIHLFRIRAVRLISMKLLLIISAIVIGIITSVALIKHQTSQIISNAKADESQPTMVNMTIGTQQKSWSDEWYEIHQATPDSVSEHIQAF